MSISTDLSIVFQGQVNHHSSNFYDNVLKTKAIFPSAEYILSTWKGAHEEYFYLFDIVILNEDPGITAFDPLGIKDNNIFRQLVSTYNGLLSATKTYAIKIRTDFSIDGDIFIKKWESATRYKNKYNLFSDRILTLTLGTNDPKKSIPLFHCSDFFNFGLREDLLEFWNIGNVSRNSTTRYYSIYEKIRHTLNGLSFEIFSVEQEILISAINKIKKVNIDISDGQQFNMRLLKLSEMYILTNFILVSYSDSGIVPPDRFRNIRSEKIHYDEMGSANLLLNYEKIFFRRFLLSLLNRFFWFLKNLPMAILGILMALFFKIKRYLYS